MENSNGHPTYGAVSNGRSSSPRHPNGNSGSGHQYEEFFGGTLPCPSCRGSGRVPRESENELVALIPFSDKRLKPRRTVLYVCIAIILCLVLAGLLVYFLYPRSVDVVVSEKNLKPSFLYINKTQSIVRMTVTVPYNISNRNFFPLEVQSLSGKVFFDQRIMANSENHTVISVPLRTMTHHFLTFNVTFDETEGYIAYYCSDTNDHTLLMPFDVTLVVDSMGRSEQITLTTYNHVQCSPKLVTTTTKKPPTVRTTTVTAEPITKVPVVPVTVLKQG